MGDTFPLPSRLEVRPHRGLVVMREADFDPTRIPALARTRDSLRAYLEVHIEQGPVLLTQNLPVGVVTSIAGNLRYLVALTGAAEHAGTVPMGLRRDADPAD